MSRVYEVLANAVSTSKQESIVFKEFSEEIFPPRFYDLKLSHFEVLNLCIFSYKKSIRDSKKIGCDTVVKHAKTD